MQGWRQPDGSLWSLNQLVPVSAAWLGIDRDLLSARVEYVLDDKTGRTTRLMLGPIEGYTPDPGAVKLPQAPRRWQARRVDLDGLAPG